MGTSEEESAKYVKYGVTLAGSTNLNASYSSTELAGMHSVDPSVNPMFFNWNHAYVHYCDGGSYSGNRAEPYVHSDGTTVYFHGALILSEVITHLLENDAYKMRKAKDVILAGESAGALGAMLNANSVGQLVKASAPKAQFRVISDAGWFIDIPDNNGGDYISRWFHNVSSTHNIVDTLNEKCTAQYSDTAKWRCMMPTLNYPYID